MITQIKTSTQIITGVVKRFLSPLLFVVALFISITGCHYSQEYQVINTDNKFSVAIPPWMKKTDGLKEGAEFQYANRYRNFYAIATADDKSKLQKPATEVMTGNLNILRKALLNPVVTDSTGIIVNGLNATRVEIFGKMNNENIYFTEVILEGTSRMYHLSIWTRGEERKLRFKEDINRIIHSFKEL